MGCRCFLRSGYGRLDLLLPPKPVVRARAKPVDLRQIVRPIIVMTTTDKNGNLAIAVCPDCDSHSVCDPAWLAIEGETLKLHCDNCPDENLKEHRIIRYAPARSYPANSGSCGAPERQRAESPLDDR